MFFGDLPVKSSILEGGIVLGEEASACTQGSSEIRLWGHMKTKVELVDHIQGLLMSRKRLHHWTIALDLDL